MAYTLKEIDRLEFLSRAGQILSSSLDYHVTLASIASLVVNNIADLCVIDLLEDDGTMKRVAARAYNVKNKELARKMFNFPADPRNQGAIYDVAKTGLPILIGKVTDKWLRESSRIPEEREVVKKLGMNSFIFVPMKSREKVMGVLTLVSNKKNFSYTEDNVVLAGELANRAGIAVDKAKLYREAQDAVRMREEFMSIAAHELRTPLTIILLHLQKAVAEVNKLVKKHTGMDEILRLLESSEKQGIRLSKMINDLLDVSLLEAGNLRLEKEGVDLNGLVEEVLGIFNIQLKKKKTFVVFDREKTPILGYWDKVRIEQVILNLLSNANKYGKGKPIEVTIRKKGRQAILAITDRGIGIKLQSQKEIFELFRRGVTSGEYKGIGIGLYITKQIVEAHGGTIDAKSRKGKGATFTVRLPLS